MFDSTERFCCNRGDETRNHLEVSSSRAKISQMALDFASAGATRLGEKSVEKDLSAAM
jgi:hypothetical protein